MRIMPPITPPTAPPTIALTFFEEDDLEVATGVIELVIDAGGLVKGGVLGVIELVIDAGRLVEGRVLGAAVANAPDPCSTTVKTGWEFRIIRDA